jgi:hypothetical protein
VGADGRVVLQAARTTVHHDFASTVLSLEDRNARMMRYFDFKHGQGPAGVVHIRRNEGRANRRASLKGIPAKPGYDRDEYPPAMSDEGGKGRTAGSLMRNQLAPYCNEQRFIFERWRNR